MSKVVSGKTKTAGANIIEATEAGGEERNIFKQKQQSTSKIIPLWSEL